MKLAEALTLRGDIQKKIDSLRVRIARCALVQEGSNPPEDPAQLMQQAFGCLNELRDLLVRINTTNSKRTLPDGRTLTEAVADRDVLISGHNLLNQAIEASHKEPDRYSNSEIRWIATLPVTALHKQLDDYAGKLRKLNLAIQQANWEIDLE